jgi:hypothetical protein
MFFTLTAWRNQGQRSVLGEKPPEQGHCRSNSTCFVGFASVLGLREAVQMIQNLYTRGIIDMAEHRGKCQGLGERHSRKFVGGSEAIQRE